MQSPKDEERFLEFKMMQFFHDVMPYGTEYSRVRLAEQFVSRLAHAIIESQLQYRGPVNLPKLIDNMCAKLKESLEKMDFEMNTKKYWKNGW